MGASHSLRLFVAEDQELFRNMLVDLCRRDWGFEVVGEAGTLAQLLALAPLAAPQVLLLDLQLPDGDGLDAVPRLWAQLPQLKILALSSLRDEMTMHRLRQSGIQGFVDKAGQTSALLREAILTVASGRMFFTEVVHAVQRKLRDDPEAFPKILSEREQQALESIGRGLSNDEAAAVLGVSAGTMHSHRRNIMRKLKLSTESELVRYCLEKGFVRPGQGLFGRPTI